MLQKLASRVDVPVDVMLACEVDPACCVGISHTVSCVFVCFGMYVAET